MCFKSSGIDQGRVYRSWKSGKYLLYERSVASIGQHDTAQKLFSWLVYSIFHPRLQLTFSQLLSDKKFQADINRDNPLGFGGSLAIAFAIILRQLWSGQRDSIEPSHLKALLANRASQFSGYAQHDAQEFMAFLLDGLHEVRIISFLHFPAIFHLALFAAGP